MFDALQWRHFSRAIGHQANRHISQTLGFSLSRRNWWTNKQMPSSRDVIGVKWRSGLVGEATRNVSRATMLIDSDFDISSRIRWRSIKIISTFSLLSPLWRTLIMALLTTVLKTFRKFHRTPCDESLWVEIQAATSSVVFELDLCIWLYRDARRSLFAIVERFFEKLLISATYLSRSFSRSLEFTMTKRRCTYSD